MEGQRSNKILINNYFYDTLHDKWYTASDHPVALLRAENAVRTPWVIESIKERFGKFAKVLDIGCGAGFLTNPLAKKGYDVTGVDLSKDSLLTAHTFDETKKVKYLFANAYDLPFASASYDVVCAMDVLEHVEQPQNLIREASRVLKPNGLFFFHTFNRNLFSFIIVIKGVEWCVKNTPKNMHVYNLFIPPKQLKKMCFHQQLHVETIKGLRPKATLPFWKMLLTRKVPENFTFTFCKSLLTGYVGMATKKENTDG